MIGGGPCTYNPEPLADFFDMFYIGEGETSYDALLDLYKECRQKGLSRKEFLLKASRIPGIYVPAFYEVTYKEDGTIASFSPTEEGVPAAVHKQVVMDVDGGPLSEKAGGSFHQSNPGQGGNWRYREAVSGAAVSARPA